MWRKTLRLFFSTQANVEVIEMLTDRDRAASSYTQIHPDLIILDVNQFGVDGLKTARELIQNNPDIFIIGVTADMSPCLPKIVDGTGIKAVIPKNMLLDYLPLAAYHSQGF